MTFWDAGTLDVNGNAINYHYQLVQFTIPPQIASVENVTEMGKSLIGNPNPILIETPVQAYQEIDANGNIIRFTDMSGNTLTSLPTTEYYICDTNPPRPIWGT